ncbi:MAG: NAD(P)/FAD-dependent oxidoreductase [Gemmatimonadota bacterium]
MRAGTEPDVLVVGAGLAGLWAARDLARGGIRVLLVDRKREVGTQVATTGIFVRRSLESFDLPEDCLGPPVRRVRLHSPAGRVLELESQGTEFRVGRMGLLYQKLLAEAVAAGVTWSPMTRFAGCEPSGNGSLVHLRRNGRSLDTTARFLIGADGARSRVARALSLDRNFSWIVGLEDVLVDVPVNGPPCFHCFLDPAIAPGYLGWLVHDGAEVHVGVAGDPARFEARRALEQLRARVGRIVPLERGHQIERRGGWIPVNGMLRNIVNHRGMLLGDAAGAVSPLTAGGLDPCLRFSEFAAEQVARYLDDGGQKVLGALQGHRFRRRFRGRLALRRIWSSIESPWAMELACALLRIPPGSWLARQVFFGSGSFPIPDSSTVPQHLSLRTGPSDSSLTISP